MPRMPSNPALSPEVLLRHAEVVGDHRLAALLRRTLTSAAPSSVTPPADSRSYQTLVRALELNDPAAHT
jgi:hypothetical protein